MLSSRHLLGTILLVLPAWTIAAGEKPARTASPIVIRDCSSDKAIILDQNTDYILQNVMVSGLRDDAAVILTGRINSVAMRKCSFGNIRAGESGRRAGVECAGATVTRLIATDTIFYDVENFLASLREGSFSLVRFQSCTFRNSPEFLKDIYAQCPWRTTPPITEFYNIETLELLDNTFSNTMVVIHPSVKKVIIRGEIPGLQIEDHNSTQVIHITPGEGEPVASAAPVAAPLP